MNRVNIELEKLQNQLSGTREAERQKQEFDGFKDLYNKFISNEDVGVQWEKIERLPDESVIAYEDLSPPTDSEIKALWITFDFG